MAEKNQSTRHETWSTLMQRVALKSTRRPAYDAVMKLKEDEVNLLRKLISEKPTPEDVQLDKAIAVLAEKAPTTETGKILKSVLDDPDRPLLARTVAAIELAHTPPGSAEIILLQHLDATEPQLAQRVLQSLGKIGSAKALQRLEAMNEPQNPAIRRQWEFSKRLIRHRLGEPAREPPRIKGTTWNIEDNEARTLPIEAIEQGRLKACIDGLKGQSLGVELAQDRGLTVAGDGIVSHLLTNDKLNTANGRKALGQAPAIAAVIALWDERMKKPVIDQVVLTTPYDQGLLVQGYRLDGVLTFEGNGYLKDGVLEFNVTGTDRPGQCRFRLIGQIRNEGLVGRAQTMPRHRGNTTRQILEATPRL